MLFVLRIVVAAFSILLTNVQSVPVLQILKGRQVVYSRIVPKGKFTLTFVHSVEKTPVYEFYRIDPDGQLVLYEARYSSYGAGLPCEPEEGFRIEDDQFVVKVTRRFKEISLRVSYIDGHGIIFENGSVMFKDIASANELITLRSGLIRVPKLLFSEGE